MGVHLKSVTLQNVFSFGPEPQTLELRPLNVLIGTNASGKSNFVDALALLASCAQDLQAGIWDAGGVETLFYNGTSEPLRLEAVLPPCGLGVSGPLPLRHVLALGRAGGGCEVQAEGIGPRVLEQPREDLLPWYDYAGGVPFLPVGPGLVEGDEALNALDELGKQAELALRGWRLDTGQSVLRQRTEAMLYPALAYVREAYGAIRVYSDWDSGRRSILRRAQDTHLPSKWLLPRAENLGLLVGNMPTWATWERIEEALGRFLGRFRGVSLRIEGGSALVCLRENGLRAPIPATRLSEGTVRFLALLAVLLHPDPPPLVVLEEPEVHMHPDAIVLIADLLKEASERMQIIVTTHSDILVDALTDRPEDVVVVTNRGEGTRLRRVQPETVARWREDDYGLGQAWLDGRLEGATRW